ncbi:hypothetical protein GE061_010415 [Apolygus lucorum]|uniref:Uncharacterized protein n=1 Tax=Apolygus lucorum TaxID=248454 RepID=A0A6A4ISY3_APOLU|nr:hypothetical protein GE061_010415 [Apolygus lucorum]
MALQLFPWSGTIIGMISTIIIAVTTSEVCGCWINVGTTVSSSAIPVTATPLPGGVTNGGNPVTPAGDGSSPSGGNMPVAGGSTPMPGGGAIVPVVTTATSGGSTPIPGLPESPAPPGVTPQAALPPTTATA